MNKKELARQFLFGCFVGNVVCPLSPLVGLQRGVPVF
jgi:hypothetical protein